MAQKITMDMELRFIDNTANGAKSASKEIDQIGKKAKEAGQEIDKLAKKKAKPYMDADTSKAELKLRKIDQKLRNLGFRRTQTVLDAYDKATSKINKVMNKVKAWSGKKFNAFLELKDSNALRTLDKMSDGLRTLTRKTFSIPVKILDYATRPLRSLQNMLFSIKGLVAAITAGFAAQQLILNPINLADSYSSAKIGFSTLLGGSRGQQMMDELDQFAKMTPFKTSGVIENAQKMMAMGWDPEKIIEDMETIGNAAAATGKMDQGLESIVRALSQIKTKGKLSTEELNQLAEAGIAAKAMLAEGLGYGTGDSGIAKMTADLEEGLIASDVAIEALLAGMKKYDGMMDSMANETVEGLKSQIADAFEISVVRKWGQGLQDGAKRGFGTVVQLLNESEAALDEFGDTLYDVGHTASNWTADKFQNAVDRILEITDSYEFKNASLSEKFKMLWKGVIADPLSEWWEGGGREKTAETAGKIGSWMGEMLTKGLLALFGATDVLNEGLGTEAGSNIAGSFLEGFLDNFDGQAITDAFVDAISNIWGALPGWAKILLGTYGVGKAAGGLANLAGGVGSFIGGAQNFIGGFGIASSAFPILTSSGSGLLGLLGKAGVGLGASTTGGALLAGGAGIAGGLAGGAALLKGGFDLYRGYTTNDALEARARKTSGWTTVGGVGSGAAIGAALGSIIPGLGTLLGGLIGAGIGGVGGWLLGDREADMIRATDDAINDVTASVEKLETEEEKLAAKSKLIWQNMKDHFGDIKLSMSEIKRLTEQIVWGDDMGKYDNFSSAMQTAASNLQALKSAGQQTNRWLWKAGLGVSFNNDEIESFAASFNDYIDSAKSYVENKHYEFTAAVSLLVDPNGRSGSSIIASGNSFYAQIQERLDKASNELSGRLELYLNDGIITLDEQKEIARLQKQVAEITGKLATAEEQAELELIKIKFGAGNLDLESFDAFMEQMQVTLEERMAANDEAFKVSVAVLNLELQEGAISQEQYNSQLQALVDGYTGKVDSVKAEILNVELDIIGDAYGISTEKLSKALQDSLAQGIDPITWTTEQARAFLGMDSLTESSAGALSQMLGNVASQLELVEVDGKLLLKLGVTVPGDTKTKVEQAIDQAVPGSVDEDVELLINPLKRISPVSLSGSELGVQNSYSLSPLVNIRARLGAVSPVSVPASMIAIQQFRGGIVGGNGIPGYADGGIVRGGAQLIQVAEEGSPEMIIPLSSQRRERALQLWKKAGEMMNVPGFARGGRTDGGDEGIRFMGNSYSGASGGQSVQVDIGGVHIEVHVDSTDSQSVADVIKQKLSEAADDIAGIFADALGAQFENTPVRGGT